MEHILSFLESNIQPWLNHALDYLDTVPSSIFMTGVVLLLLHLCYLVFKVFFLTHSEKPNIPKSFALCVPYSHLGQHQDRDNLQQLLRPDNLCKMFNEVSHLVSLTPLEDVASIQTPLDSTGYVRKSSPSKFPALSSVPGGELLPASLLKLSPPSSFSLPPNMVMPSADLLSPSPLSDSLPPEPLPALDSKATEDPLPPPSLSLPPPPPHPTQETDTLLPQDATLPVVSNPAGLSTSVPVGGMDHSSTEPPAKNMLSSNLAQDGVKQQFLALCSENLSGGDTVAYCVETHNIWFRPPAVLICLERQIKKRGDVLKWKEKEKKAESFPKQHQPNYQGFSSEKRSESAADQQDSAISLLSWNEKGKSEEPQVDQQSPYPRSFEDHLQKNYTQLFYGVPSLHPKSLSPSVPASGDYSSAFVCFNTASNDATAHKSPVLLYTPPAFLPFRICGVRDLGHKNEALSLVPSEIHDLEYNVTQKSQESLWGLPSVVHKSQEDFCPPAPNIVLVNPSSKAHVAISILPGNYPLSDDLQKKLDHHLRKRRIQHLWGLPRRVYASLSLMRPLEKIPETSESKSSHGLSRKSLDKSQSTKDINKGGSSQPRNLHELSSGMLPLKMGVRKAQRDGTKIEQNRHVLSDRDNVLGSSSRKDLEHHLQSPSGGTPSTSMVNSLQKQLENALNSHLSKKFQEISEGQIPGTVHRSWHSIKLALPVSEKSTRQTSHKPLAPTRTDSSVNTTQAISFLDAGKKRMMVDHITLFHKRLIYGLPNRVQESLEIFNEKDSYHSFSHSKFPCSATRISGVDSKQSMSKTHGGRYSAFHGDKEKTKDATQSLDRPLLATSVVVKKEQAILTQTVFEIKHEHVEDLRRIKDGKPSVLPQTQSIIGKAYQKPPVAANRCSPKLARRQAGVGPQETGPKRLSSSYSVARPQGNRMPWGSSSMSKISEKSRETLKAQELYACQSQPPTVLTTRKPESSPVSDVYTPENSPKLPVVRDPGLSHLNNPLLGELRAKMKKGEPSQKQGHSNGIPLVSNSLTSKTFLKHDQGAACKNMAVSQVLHVHLDNTQSKKHGQGPWVPKLDFHKGQDKNCPATAKTMTPPGPKTLKLGGRDAGLGTCQPRRRSHHPQDRTLEQTLGSKSCSAQSLKGQAPPESLRNQMKNFFQWLYPNIKGKRQEGSPENGSSPSSPVQGRGLVQRRAAFTGNTDNPRIMRDGEKVLGEKRGHWHGINVTCPQEPHLSPKKSGKTQPKAGLEVQAEFVQVHPFNYKAPCSKVTRINSMPHRD
ncbi:spermatogenesis-associated protein 31D1-like [Marmota flaviventris]|uniref:spermatogenesis-associated protein 31D1-like n=1 Tax=Marmota flaviventris TaxID=93162 RepID=UPI003A838B50